MLVLKVRVLPGDVLEETIEKAIILAARLGLWVEFKFNGIELSVSEHSNIAEVAREYHDGLGKQR